MPKEPREHAKGKMTGKEVAEVATGVVTAGVGGLLTLDPHLALLGVGIGAASQLVSTTAGCLAARIAEVKARRVEKVARAVFHRLEGEPDSTKRAMVEELFVSAIPFIEDAETKAKLQMIENLLVNSAEIKDSNAQAQAFVALEQIKLMPAHASMLFACLAGDIAARLKPSQIESLWNHPNACVEITDTGCDCCEISYHGLGRLVVERGCWYLLREASVPLLHSDDWSHGESKRRIQLSKFGGWLADWIIDNRQPSK